jgi:pilus assembly protein TadC
MRFRIPFTSSPVDTLRRRSKPFIARIKYKRNTKLGDLLKSSGMDISREEYLGICLRGTAISFVFLFIISTTVLFALQVPSFWLLGAGMAFLFSMFMFGSQAAYPKIFASKRQKNIEKNLISALEDMSVQLSSGIPLFNIMANISSADYGELSIEFKKAVKRINAGEPEIEVLNDLGKKNPSHYFRRTLWQISNGMMAGANMTSVVKDSIKSLNEEQMIQIQNYGNKLNPLMVFYMLISVIVPSLSVAFLTIIASMINLTGNVVMLLFLGLYVMVFLIQIMFIGLIRSGRPSLL